MLIQLCNAPRRPRPWTDGAYFASTLTPLPLIQNVSGFRTTPHFP